MSTSALKRDLDIHNATVDERLAGDGYCAIIHLPTGRICTLAARHPGGCEFTSRVPSTTTGSGDAPVPS